MLSSYFTAKRRQAAESREGPEEGNDEPQSVVSNGVSAVLKPMVSFTY